MNKILYLIEIDTCRKIKVRKRFLFFHINKKIKEIYKYWIEFRIDEKRFWYGETKPIWNTDLDCFELKTNYVMTKNGCERSLNIIEGIVKRTVDLCPDYKIFKNLNEEWGKYRAYDKIEEKSSTNAHQSTIQGMFLR